MTFGDIVPAKRGDDSVIPGHAEIVGAGFGGLVAAIALAERGWSAVARRIEGRNCNIEDRWAEGNVARLPELAEDLVRQNVDVILAGGSVGAEAAKRATSTIPIVAAGVGDLVELGLVRSLAHPAGNLTGFVAAFSLPFPRRPACVESERSLP